MGTQEVKAGTALVFTTPEGIRTLRERVARLIVPAELRSVPPRLDNIHGGVRLIFETEATAEVDALRRNVREHARRLAQTCELVFVGPVDGNVLWQTREEAPPPPRALEKSHTKVTKKEEPKKPSDSKVEKSPSDEQPRQTDQGKPKPLKPEKRKEPDKPAIRDTPKEGPKPPLPRLPGIRPEPFQSSVDQVELSAALPATGQRVDWPALLRRWAEDAPLSSRGESASFIDPRGSGNAGQSLPRLGSSTPSPARPLRIAGRRLLPRGR